MDTSYLAQQVNSSIAQLHGLFDEIGVPNHEREARESEVILADFEFIMPVHLGVMADRFTALRGSVRSTQ